MPIVDLLKWAFRRGRRVGSAPTSAWDPIMKGDRMALNGRGLKSRASWKDTYALTMNAEVLKKIRCEAGMKRSAMARSIRMCVVDYARLENGSLSLPTKQWNSALRMATFASRKKRIA